MPGGYLQHAARSQAVADAVGVDIGAALAAGRLGVESWRAAIVSCRGCGQELACADWMGSRAAGRTVLAPGFCANLALFETLRRGRL